MRVLLVSNTYPPADISGVGTLVFELGRELERSGHHAVVLTRRVTNSDGRAIALAGPKLLWPLRAGLWYLGRAISAPSFDVVHVHESDGLFVALIARLERALRRRRAPRIAATLQVSYVEERRAVREVRDGAVVVSRPVASERIFAWIRAPLLAWMGRWTARLADVVVAPSEATARELERDYGINGVRSIPNGIAVALRPAAPAPENQEAVVLFVGRLRTRKAVAVLVSAMRRLRDESPSARLLVAGDGEQREALEQQIRSEGLEQRVELLGAVPRDGLDVLWARASVFCLPSTYEGFPLAILEAMAWGLPVVASRVSGIPEAVEDGVTGYLVAPEDGAVLSAALAKLLGGRQEAKAMGERGRQRLVDEFSITAVTGRYLELWSRLVSPDGAFAADPVRSGGRPTP